MHHNLLQYYCPHNHRFVSPTRGVGKGASEGSDDSPPPLFFRGGGGGKCYTFYTSDRGVISAKGTFLKSSITTPLEKFLPSPLPTQAESRETNWKL